MEGFNLEKLLFKGGLIFLCLLKCCVIESIISIVVRLRGGVS